MSTTLKWVLAIIILAGAGWLLWWSGWLGSMNGGKTQTASVANTATTTQATTTAPTNGMSALNDSSDVALAQDVAAVEAQLQMLSKDGVQVTASLADKPVAQSY